MLASEDTVMNAAMKQDLWFVLVAVLLAAGFMAGGVAMGNMEFARVADAILTPWSMFGLGVLFVAAILYTALKSAVSGSSAEKTHHGDKSP